MKLCHYGIELPDDPKKPCPKCGAKMGETCGRAYQAGFRDAYDAAIAILRKHAQQSLVIDQARRTYFLASAEWLEASRPPESL